MSWKLYKEFANKTHFVGFKESVDSRGTPWKIYWGLLLALAICSTGIALVKTFLEYAEDRTATTVSELKLEQFPSVAICPFNWVDEAKAERLGFTPNDLAALTSVSRQGGPFLASTGSENARADLLQYVSHRVRQMSIRNTHDRISYNTSDILEISDEIQQRVETRKIIDSEGACYMLSIPEKIHRLGLQHLWLEVYLTYKPTLQASSLTTDYKAAGLLVSLTLDPEPDLDTMIPLPLRTSFVVSFTVTRTKRATTTKSPCKPWFQADRRECLKRSTNRLCRALGAKPFFTADKSGNETLVTVSSYFDYSSHCSKKLLEILQKEDLARKGRSGTKSDVDFNKLLTDGEQTCPLACDSYSISPTLISHGKSDDNISLLSFAYTDVRNARFFEEYRVNSLAGLVNNIGGGLSLWMGACILSVFHLPYFLLNALFNRASRVHSGGSAKVEGLQEVTVK